MNKLPSKKVYVGNLPDDCDKEKLQKLFESVGPIAEFDVVKNFGFVHYETEEGAKRAAEELNETEFEGRMIKVEASRSKVRHKPGMGDMTECYRCGRDGHWSKDCPKAGRGRGRGRGGPLRPTDSFGPPGFRDPYADPYADPYYRGRYLPPGYDRYHPYGEPYDRRPAPYRDPYYERDPYARPPVDYYDRLPARDPYYDYYARRRLPIGLALPAGYPIHTKFGIENGSLTRSTDEYQHKGNYLVDEPEVMLLQIPADQIFSINSAACHHSERHVSAACLKEPREDVDCLDREIQCHPMFTDASCTWCLGYCYLQ